MSKRTQKPAMPLPHILTEAIKEQRVVIVFGAGSSMECTDPSGKSAPSANQLRDYLAKKFLGLSKDERDLATVTEMAIANHAGEVLVFEEIANILGSFTPSEAHIKLGEFRWRGLATTNYDTFIEQGYARSTTKRQTCLPFIKNAEPFDDRLRRESAPVPLLKQHGCINHRLDPEIPLVLSHAHYNRYKNNREHLFERLRHWAQTSPIIFMGYRLADPHLQSLIYEIDPGKRPQWYIVSPGADQHDRQFWATKNVEVLNGTFSQFVHSLDHAIPELFRSLSRPKAADDAPYRRFFRSNDVGSDALRRSIEIDIEYIHAGLSFDEVAPQKFYAGHDRGWCCVVRKYDFSRKTGEDLLYASLDETDQNAQRFLLLQGSAGAGKTIALRRAAYDAATALEEMVFWLRDTGHPRAEVFEELYGLTGRRPLLFVDHISMHSDAILTLLKHFARKRIPITVVASEREADWGSYCQTLEEYHPPKLFTLRRLSTREAEDLVALLERHECLGLLATKPRKERIAAFLDETRADRQLLVALHELTRGKPFEVLIREEYDNITPNAARQLYLDVATMHQFDVVARAGAISRISGIRFTDFEERFFAPLRDIVQVVSDPYTDDKGYRSRHTRVSEILFGVACPSDEDKSRQLARVLNGLDVGFSSDRRIVESVCRGRAIAERFVRIEAAREIVEAAISSLPNSAFLYQQAAILEYVHSRGSLERAQELAEAARELDDNNHIYIHTLAEVARRQANVAGSRVKREKLRAQARIYLNEIWLKVAPKDLTFCRLLMDEAIDLLQQLPDEPNDHHLIEFDEKVADAIDRLRRGQQDFPNDPEFASAEGYLWQKLGETQKASYAFEKAISVRPRHSGAYARLSRIQRASGSVEKAEQTLTQALERFPNDKSVHLQLAMLTVENGGEDADRAEYHFRSSFGAGDQNFEARFLFAEYLFWLGRTKECNEIFRELPLRNAQAACP